jgi:modulator of FtsH protease HflC
MAARIGIVLALVVGLIYLCAFRVYEYEHAILFQLGKIQRSDYEPGLYFKFPPPFQNVRTFDKRLQTLDSEPQRFLTGEKKDLIVDSFVRWKIQNVVLQVDRRRSPPRRTAPVPEDQRRIAQRIR